MPACYQPFWHLEHIPTAGRKHDTASILVNGPTSLAPRCRECCELQNGVAAHQLRRTPSAQTSHQLDTPAATQSHRLQPSSSRSLCDACQTEGVQVDTSAATMLPTYSIGSRMNLAGPYTQQLQHYTLAVKLQDSLAGMTPAQHRAAPLPGGAALQSQHGLLCTAFTAASCAAAASASHPSTSAQLVRSFVFKGCIQYVLQFAEAVNAAEAQQPAAAGAAGEAAAAATAAAPPQGAAAGAAALASAPVDAGADAGPHSPAAAAAGAAEVPDLAAAGLAAPGIMLSMTAPIAAAMTSVSGSSLGAAQGAGHGIPPSAEQQAAHFWGAVHDQLQQLQLESLPGDIEALSCQLIVNGLPMQPPAAAGWSGNPLAGGASLAQQQVLQQLLQQIAVEPVVLGFAPAEPAAASLLAQSNYSTTGSTRDGVMSDSANAAPADGVAEAGQHPHLLTGAAVAAVEGAAAAERWPGPATHAGAALGSSVGGTAAASVGRGAPGQASILDLHVPADALGDPPQADPDEASSSSGSSTASSAEGAPASWWRGMRSLWGQMNNGSSPTRGRQGSSNPTSPAMAATVAPPPPTAAGGGEAAQPVRTAKVLLRFPLQLLPLWHQQGYTYLRVAIGDAGSMGALVNTTWQLDELTAAAAQHAADAAISSSCAAAAAAVAAAAGGSDALSQLKVVRSAVQVPVEIPLTAELLRQRAQQGPGVLPLVVMLGGSTQLQGMWQYTSSHGSCDIPTGTSSSRGSDNGTQQQPRDMDDQAAVPGLIAGDITPLQLPHLGGCMDPGRHGGGTSSNGPAVIPAVVNGNSSSDGHLPPELLLLSVPVLLLPQAAADELLHWMQQLEAAVAATAEQGLAYQLYMLPLLMDVAYCITNFAAGVGRVAERAAAGGGSSSQVTGAASAGGAARSVGAGMGGDRVPGPSNRPPNGTQSQLASSVSSALLMYFQDQGLLECKMLLHELQAQL